MIAVSPAADRGRCGNSDDVEEKRAKEGEAAAAVGWGHLYEMAGGRHLRNWRCTGLAS